MAKSLVLNRSRKVPAEDTAAFGAIAERFRRAGALERAVELCREGLQKFPDHISARVTLGWSLLDLGKYDEARVELEQVLRRAPDNLAAIRGLAELHDRFEHTLHLPMDGPGQWPPPPESMDEAGASADAHRVIAQCRALLSERGTAHVDKRAGVLQVTDFTERMDRVALYVEALQQRSARQVRLQAQVFEVTLREGASIDWRKVRERLGLPADSPQAGIAGDPIALRAALAAQGDVRTLWAPEVTAINNEPALMRVATPGGTSLTVTIVPQISADGIVQMSVSHAWEEHAGDRKSGWFSSTPIGRLSETDTVMRVMDGNTSVLAGILRPQEVTVPSSGGFGSVFGAQTKRMGHAELIVLLRPTVVTAGTFSAGGSR